MDATPRLTREDKRTLGLSSLGGALEFYDFVIYVFYAKIISELFFPAGLSPFWAMLNTYGIFAAGYFFRPLGGVIMAHFGDLLGRKRLFSLSILLMALPTLMIGVMPTFETIGYAAPLLLLLMRVVQGIAIGGEIPAAWTFVSEHVPAEKIGFANGLLTAGLSLGILLGALMSLFISLQFSEAAVHDSAWRIPFIVGGIFGLVALYLRSYLKETPVFKAMQARKELSKEMPVKQVLANHKPAVVIGMLLTWFLTACVVVLILAMPNCCDHHANAGMYTRWDIGRSLWCSQGLDFWLARCRRYRHHFLSQFRCGQSNYCVCTVYAFGILFRHSWACVL